MITSIFHAILYQPIFNLFVGAYNIFGDAGVAIVLLTLFMKLVLWPLTAKSITAQRSLTALQPKLEALKKEHKSDQQRLAQETMKLYQENKVNPVGSCLPMLIQIPVFLALYWVLQSGLGTTSFDMLYSFVPNPGHIDAISFGFLDLSKMSVVLAVLAGGSQFFQARSLQQQRPPKEAGPGAKDEDMMTIMNKQMLFMMPIMTTVVSLSLPSGIALYWFLSTLITLLQQHLMRDKTKQSIAVL